VYDVPAGRNVYVSAHAATVLGYDATEALRADSSEFLTRVMHPEDHAGPAGQIARLGRGRDGEILDYEYRMRHRSGEWRWFLSRNAVLARTAAGWERLSAATRRAASDVRKAWKGCCRTRR
jgi:PAS domain-containing protein